MKKVDIHPRVNVRAFGAYPEGLLNAAASAGLELWSLNRIDQHSVGFELYEMAMDASVDGWSPAWLCLPFSPQPPFFVCLYTARLYA